MNLNTYPLSPFLGVNNRLPDYSMATKSGRYLRTADNVEITNSGTINLRHGETRIQALNGAHSLHGNYLVRGSVLYRVTLPSYDETLVKILTTDDPMSYAEYNGDLYFSNGTDSGRIDKDGQVWPWALPTPAEPLVSSRAGSMLGGMYQVALSYSNSATGEEGGVSPSNNFDLAGGGGLRVTLPASVPGATHINIYCSAKDGSVPLLQATVPVGATLHDIDSVAIGKEQNQRYEAPLPAGERVFVFNGSLCSVNGDTIYLGLPYRHGYYKPADGWLKFPADVAVAVPAQNGIYAVADQTYFFAGSDVNNFERVIDVLPYGAAKGTEFSVPNAPIVGWFGRDGIVLADKDGNASAVMADNVAVTQPESGRSFVFTDRGYRRVYSCGWILNLENKAATTYSGWNVTSMSGGYATKSDGIYTLGTAGGVVGRLGFGKDSFGTELLKSLPSVYLGIESDEPLQVSIAAAGGQAYDYCARGKTSAMEIERVDIGKGLRSNWFEIEIANPDGADFVLSQASVLVAKSTRRI